MVSEFAWGNPAVCINGDGRPARFRKNTLCFVCAVYAEREEAAERANQEYWEARDKAAEKSRLEKIQAEEDYFEELNDELLDEGQTKRRY